MMTRSDRGLRWGSERRGFGALESEEGVAQFAESAVGADLGGPHRAFEDVGDFCERQFLESREEEDFAVVGIEQTQGCVQQGVVVAGRRLGGGMRCVVGVVAEIGRVRGERRGLGVAEVIGGATPGQVVHPGRETALVPIGVAVLQHALEDRLGDVLGGGAIPGELHQEPEEWPMMALKKFAQRVEFAVANSPHQGMIGTLVGRGVHRVRRAGAFIPLGIVARERNRAASRGWLGCLEGRRRRMEIGEKGNHVGSRASLGLSERTARCGWSYKVSRVFFGRRTPCSGALEERCHLMNDQRLGDGRSGQEGKRGRSGVGLERRRLGLVRGGGGRREGRSAEGVEKECKIALQKPAQSVKERVS